jgi:hypothetical protein
MVLAPDATEAEVIEPPGDLIWAALAGPVDTAELAATLATDFGAPLAVVRADVERFVEQLLARGLVIETVAAEADAAGEAG